MMKYNTESKNADNIWFSGIMGVVVGDALGCPVQFRSRKEVREDPVTTMLGHGTYDMPAGTWTDDSSMTLALLASIRDKDGINLEDIMNRFVRWIRKGEYTPFGEAFDVGNGTMAAILRYMKGDDLNSCGGITERDNGNGSLMRILPACIYAYTNNLSDEDAVSLIHQVAGLTHNHIRGQIACGLYFFCVKSVLDKDGTLMERLQKGFDTGFNFYDGFLKNTSELSCYDRLRDMKKLSEIPESGIKSSGYVVDTIEAAVWSLVSTDSFKNCELKAVNLGDDSDTVGATAGGLAGLFYGYDGIPEEWLEVIQRREWIEELCK
ncbi:ADP-ribosylglycohydrolase family protein [Butyrivibrio sp. JL13D10]|uniref:ADP-ribosylglycohydrolase family protein n=1 Tax=Butyrivibrio sp. JL13D10 TaxID=3236815 RepID=UPI0038B51D5B